MAFDFHSRRARFLVLAGLVAVLAGTLTSFLSRRWQARDDRPLPTPIAADIDQQTQAFSLSKTLGDHTVYTIQAQQVTNFKDTGKALLRGVSILIYGKAGTRRDRISSRECEYDPASASLLIPGEVEMQLEVPLAQPGSLSAQTEVASMPVSIFTSGLLFDQATGIASTDAPVRFRFAQGEGTSRGANYDPQEQLLVLKSRVEFLLRDSPTSGADSALEDSDAPGKNPGHTEPIRSEGEGGTRVRAGSLRFYRQEGKILLEDSIEITKGSRQLQAGRAEIALDEAYQARTVKLAGDLFGAEQSSTHSMEVRAARGLAQFTGQGGIQMLRLEEAVRWATHSLPSRQAREGEAQRVELLFQEPTGFLERVQAYGDVQVVLGRIGEIGSLGSLGLSSDRTSGIEPGTETQIFSAQEAEMVFASDGETLRQVQMRSSPSLQLLPDGAGTDRRTVTGDAFQIEFNSQGEISEFAAQGNVRVLTEDTGEVARERVTTSDSLRATFDPPTGALDRVRQWGHVHYRDPDREAQAEQADYVTGEEIIALEGKSLAWNSQGRISANRVELKTKTGEWDAEGNVSTTFFQEASPGNPSPEPIHGVADRFQYVAVNERAHYQGQARLWQGMNFLLEAEWLELRQKEGELFARSKVYSVFRPSPDARKSKEATAPPAVSSRNNSESFVIRSDSLLYQQEYRKAHYRGAVQLQNASGTVTAAELEIFFQPPADGIAPVFALSAGEIERAVARENVQITDGQRKATGDRAEYLPGRGEVHLYGRLATVSDPQRGSTQGARLTYFVGDDRIRVEGEPGLPTETRWQVHP